MTFEQELDELGEFWEKIEFPNGLVAGKARSKKELWTNYIGAYFEDKDFADKRVLDLGCNAGGNIIELAKFAPRQIVGVEGSQKYAKQARFVIRQFGVDANIIEYNFNGKSAEDYKAHLGEYDAIFCLGIIYHLMRDTNLALLEYIKENASKKVFSTQLFISEDRGGLDWETTREGTYELFEAAGYSRLETIYLKSDDEPWRGLTNQWYFEAF